MEPIVREELDFLREELDVLRHQVADLVKMVVGVNAPEKVVSHKKIKGAATEDDEVIPPSDPRVAKG